MQAGSGVLYGTASVTAFEVRSYQGQLTGQLGRLVVRAAEFPAPGGEIPQAQPSSELNPRKGRLF